MIRMLILLFLILPLAVTAKDNIQTINTEYARIHFHKDYQKFAEQVADKLDDIYLDVSKRVGFKQNDKIDFLIADDIHQANGYAVPLAAGKIVKIYTSAPSSAQALGSYEDWLDLVISHELTHKIHISEPSRSWRSLFDKALLNADTINFTRYPRWVSEGYATLIETEHTKQGRLNSDFVKALLQQWAVEGQLPSYETINGNDSYVGNRMAYYQGGAFLYWLQTIYGKDKLTQLWHRSSAAKYRDFDEAFTGLFLESPQRLYKQFVAEQTYLAKKHALKQEPTGNIWQDNNYQVLSSEPSVAQNKILQLEKDKNGFITLNVYGLSANDKAREKFVKANQELLANDALDVPDTQPAVFNRKAELVVKPNRKHQWQQAHWLDNEHALVLQYLIEDNHELGFELAKVNLKTGSVEKITEKLRLHSYSVMPDKQSVIAVSHFAGFNQLIQLSLKDGSYTTLTDKKLNVQMDNLTISPDGKSLALMANDDKHWKIHLFSLENKTWQVAKLFAVDYMFASEEASRTLLAGNYLSYLRWQDDGLYFSRSTTEKTGRSVNVFKLNFKTFMWQQLSEGYQLTTQAFTIKPTEENKLLSEQLFYLVTTSQGQDTYIQSRAYEKGKNRPPKVTQGRFELHHIEKSQAKPLVHQVKVSHDYGIGPQAYTLALGGYTSSDEDSIELVARGGDPLGRLRWQGAYNNGDIQQEAALNIKSNWLNMAWYGELVNAKGQDSDYRSTAVNGELAYSAPLSFYSSVKLALGLGSEDTENAILADKINHYRLQGQYQFEDAIGKLSYGYALKGLLIDYSGDYQDWQRVDYGMDLVVGYNNARLSYQYVNNELDDNAPLYQLLTLGGQISSANSQVANHKMLDAKLPFAWQTGYEFEQQKINLNVSGVDLFYLKHQADNNDALAAYGVQVSSSTLDISPLLDGITIQAGFTWYETAIDNSNHQYHLSATYQFK